MTQAVSLESSDWRMIASHLAFKRLPQLEKSFNSQDWELHHMDPQNAPEVTTAWLGNSGSPRSEWGGDIGYQISRITKMLCPFSSIVVSTKHLGTAESPERSFFDSILCPASFHFIHISESKLDGARNRQFSTEKRLCFE